MRSWARAGGLDCRVIRDSFVGVRGDNHRLGDHFSVWDLGLNCFVFSGHIDGCGCTKIQSVVFS
jgi:hypothetical protein